MREIEERMKRHKGYKIIGGDFNFVMDTRYDKIGGNKKRGMDGKREQKNWEDNLEMDDVWRERHENEIGWTCQSKKKKAEIRVKTRLDRWLIDRRLCEQERIKQVEIERSVISDHEPVTVTLEVDRKKQTKTKRIAVMMLEDEEYCKEVEKIFEEEKKSEENIMIRHERFKRRVLEEAERRMKKIRKKKRKKRYERNKEIKVMRRVVEWTENARLQIEKRRKVKRVRRGNKLLREARVRMWMKKEIGEIEDIEELDREANIQLRKLIKERDESDDKKIRARETVERLQEIDEDEKNTRMFFDRVKLDRKKDEIEKLEEEIENDETKEMMKVDREDREGKGRIVKKFYEDLWSKRRVSHRMQTKLIDQIETKLNEEESLKCEGEITKEEINKTKKKLTKRKATGIDGIPAEFWQKFDFVDEWLEEVFKEIQKRGTMTKSMRTAIVKLIFKKGKRNDIGNYRPISLLCSDYKILAKIVTERMKGVLAKLIDKAQQGFIKDGDITGNLILVKEIIEYCNENDEEGAIILMDFKKAYDRVDRGAVFRVLEKMGFGRDFVDIVKVLYNEVTAMMEIGEGDRVEVETGGGVRQGCPLSPYLFICVLELMAIEVRENEKIKGIIEPDSKKEDKLSLFADDSSMFLGKPSEQMVEARVALKNYEKATGSALHDKKCKIFRMGKTRKEEMTAKQLGVEFEIMKEDEKEVYLGDMIGNEIEEEERFEEGMKKMKRVAKRWKREEVGIYGRAIVANTLMMSKVKYRADVNPISEELKKSIKEEIREYVWEGKKSEIAWKKVIQGVDEGGIGLRDPACTIDAAKIRIVIKNMRIKSDQPWAKWMKRKERRLKRRWGVEDIYGHKPTRNQIEELKDKCLFESTMKIWMEIGGESGRRKVEEGTREWQDTKRGYALARHQSQNIPYIIKFINKQEKDEEERREEMKEEIGMMTERGWKKIENIKTKEIYERLKKKRYGEMKKEEMRVNHATTTIRKKLTPKERQFWLRCAYQTIQPNKRKSKWLKQRNGEEWTDKCPTCKKEVETWSHMEYECEKLESYMYEVRWVYDEYVIRNEIKNAQEWTTPTIDEWRLETGTEMTTERMLVIAKARWVFHCERARCDHKQRRTLKIDR